MIKFLHIIGVIMFLGNIIISAFWRFNAERTGKSELISHAYKLTSLTDWIFTLPGVILIGITGHMLAPKFGGIAAQPWIYHSYAMLTVSALIWLAGLLPIQLKQRRLMASDPLANLSPQFKKLTLWWHILGLVATILPLVALFWMTARAI
jgi:uncharacterized membrane protein